MRLDRLIDDPRVAVRRPGSADPDGDVVVYWMQRAQRACDNPALDVAIQAGNALRKPVVVFFGLNPFVARANLRHYTFLAEGLPDIATGLAARRVGFATRRYPHHRLLPFLETVHPAMVVGDENPLRQPEAWRTALTDTLKVPFWTIDADVVVPSSLIETERYSARTIRPRIHRHLAAHSAPSTDPVAQVPWIEAPGARDTTPVAVLDGLPINRAVGPVSAFQGGTKAARQALRRFVVERLGTYDDDRNHPERPGTSELSPYLHFGHIGPREVVHAVRTSGAPDAAIAAFIEQLVVRRELAVNFVRYNDAYDRLDGCEPWARRTLRRHAFDARPSIYQADALETADTHDPLWNAAQRQMVSTGWMHNYVRMYWAKKILEWSPSAAAAFAVAVALNDRYEIDGRDPNGYANIAWAIGGQHDRPWPERPVFGTIRSMTLASTRRKFDARRYIEQFGTTSDVDRYAALAGKPRLTR